MLPALFRAIYFLGPLLALAIVLMPRRKQIARACWAIAAVIVAFHWISFFSAKEDNATEIGTLWAANSVSISNTYFAYAPQSS